MVRCDRDEMIRDRFIIAAQRTCSLSRHLDGVPPDTPIRDIVDRFRVWESHSEQTESGQGVDLDQDPPEWSGVSGRPGALRGKSNERMVSSVGDLQIMVPVASVILNDGGTHINGRWRMKTVSLPPWRSYPHW